MINVLEPIRKMKKIRKTQNQIRKKTKFQRPRKNQKIKLRKGRAKKKNLIQKKMEKIQNKIQKGITVQIKAALKKRKKKME